MHVSWVIELNTLHTCIWLKTLFCRRKSVMVAESFLDASLLETKNPAPYAICSQAMASAGGEGFIPILIAEYPDPGEEVDGAVLLQLSCRCLAVGQALLAVGGYIVRGIKKICGQRVIAIRHSNGAFDAMDVALYGVVGRASQQITLPAAAAATSPTMGIGNQVLAISSTPSPEPNLLPQLEAQAQMEAAQPLPIQSHAQVEAAQVSLVQERMQIFERPITNNDEDKQKIIDDNEITRLNRVTGGKQPIIVQNTIGETGAIINALLDKVAYLEILCNDILVVVEVQARQRQCRYL